MEQKEIQERNEQIATMLKWIKRGEMYSPSENDFFLENLTFHSDWNWLHEAIQFLHKHFESKEWSWLTIEKYPLYSEIEEVFIVVSDFAKHFNNKEL